MKDMMNYLKIVLKIIFVVVIIFIVNYAFYVVPEYPADHGVLVPGSSAKKYVSSVIWPKLKSCPGDELQKLLKVSELRKTKGQVLNHQISIN